MTATMNSDHNTSSSGDTAGVRADTDPRGNINLISKTDTLFQRARDGKRPITAQMNRNYYTLYMRPANVGSIVNKGQKDVPEIYPVIEALVAWKTDQEPEFDAVPVAQPNSPHFAFYDQLGDHLLTCVNAVWLNQNFGDEIEAGIFDAETYHHAIWKVTWDSSVSQLGDVSLRRIDPFSFYVDPAAKHPRDANYFVEVRTMAAQDCERLWPGSIAKLNGNFQRTDFDIAPSRMTNPSGEPAMASPGYITNSDNQKNNGNWSNPGAGGGRDRMLQDNDGITVQETWIRVPTTVKVPYGQPESMSAHDRFADDPDYGMETDELNDPMNTEYGDNLGQSETGHDAETFDRTFDTWRCVVTSGNVVISDCAATDMWSHGRHPYVFHRPKQTGELYAPSMVEMLAPSQEAVNNMLRSIGKNLALMGDPIMVNKRDTGIRRSAVTNVPGQRLQVKSTDDVKWLDPPTVHPQAAGDMIAFHVGEMERISGLSAVVRGATPTGRNAQGVIDSVQEAAFVRIRLHIRNLERSLQEIVNLVAALICEFYDEPRLVAYAPNDGAKTSLAISTLHFYDPTPANRVPLRYQVMIRAGSAMPTSRQARAAEADLLFGMGALDTAAVLEAHKYPDRVNISQRVMAQQAAAGTVGQPPSQRAATGR